MNEIRFEDEKKKKIKWTRVCIVVSHISLSSWLSGPPKYLHNFRENIFEYSSQSWEILDCWIDIVGSLNIFQLFFKILENIWDIL